MSEPFVGEIRMFAGNFAPLGWAYCDGQLLAVSQNDALFSLFGTMYGGDGRSTFGLPDLRGRIPVHAGSGPGLSARQLGSKYGSEKVTLTKNQLPSHDHTPLKASLAQATSTDPTGRSTGQADKFTYRPTSNFPPNQAMSSESTSKIGGSLSHTNLQPYLCIHFIVALYGIYPSRH